MFEDWSIYCIVYILTFVVCASKIVNFPLEVGGYVTKLNINTILATGYLNLCLLIIKPVPLIELYRSGILLVAARG